MNFNDKTKCCGCSACFSVCPKKCISMVRDDEGFLYPKIDKKKCINCGLCKKVCPIINAHENKKEKHTYIFQYNDDKIRRESTSGGAFTAIAENIIEKGGIVYGVAFDEEFKVIHTCVSKKEELFKFRNSKYVQSDPRNTFKEVKEKLDKGILVCYSGTSCQIEGLKNFLMHDYDNLILIDVVCRAVPSPLVWEKYLKLRNKKYKNISRIFFRDKYYGYKYSNLSIYNKNHDKNNEYHSGIESDPYLRSFFSNICDRPSCYDCKFKKDNRESDITIWDCFEVEQFNKKLDDDKGTTKVMTNSKKGEKILQELSNIHTCEEINFNDATNNFLAMYNSVKMNNKRDEFFKDLNKLSEEELFTKYFPDTIKVKIERNVRKILLKMKIYKPLLKLGKKIRKRD